VYVLYSCNSCYGLYAFHIQRQQPQESILRLYAVNSDKNIGFGIPKKKGQSEQTTTSSSSSSTTKKVGKNISPNKLELMSYGKVISSSSS